MWIANDRGWSLLTHEAGNGIRSWSVGSFASSASINHLIMLIWDIKHGTVNNLLGDDYGGDSDNSAPAHHNWSCIWHAEVVMVTWVDRTGVIVIFFLQDLNLCCRSVTVTRTSLPRLLPSPGYPPVHEYMQISVRLCTQEEEDSRLQTSH